MLIFLNLNLRSNSISGCKYYSLYIGDIILVFALISFLFVYIICTDYINILGFSLLTIIEFTNYL